ncbi:MAG TPA: ribosome maturation factor RimM [Coxiellaceae bacterium]|nr:ribosome maturation factor RimM [Coxiellaceae bacterium]
MSSSHRSVVLGKIGRPHGVKGWFYVHSYTDPITNVLTYPDWHLNRLGKMQTYTLETGKQHADKLVAKVKGVEDREAASQLTHALIEVPRNTLPPLEKNQYYWSDLIGLTVITLQGKVLGTVKEITQTAASDILVVMGKKRLLIPYLPHVILSVDLDHHRIEVDWDEL